MDAHGSPRLARRDRFVPPLFGAVELVYSGLCNSLHLMPDICRC
jgi:hypothetical protein